MRLQESRFVIAEGVLRAEVEGEEVLLNPDSGIYHLVNKTGRMLLVRMEEGDTLSAAARHVASTSGEPLERVADDARAFVAAMLARGLIAEAT